MVPSNGLVDLRISAVHSTTNYYARILRHRGEDGRVIDMTAQHCIVEEQIKNYFSAGAQKVARGSVQVGDLYATLVMGSIYDRVRVECILDVDDEVTELYVFLLRFGSEFRSFGNTFKHGSSAAKRIS